MPEMLNNKGDIFNDQFSIGCVNKDDLKEALRKEGLSEQNIKACLKIVNRELKEGYSVLVSGQEDGNFSVSTLAEGKQIKYVSNSDCNTTLTANLKLNRTN
jgi:transcriptional regulator NrdR family protein